MINYMTLNELHGIKIFVDNRIKRGKLMPYKNRTDSIRCSKETLDALKAAIDRQDYDEIFQRISWAAQYGMKVLTTPTPVIGATTA